MALLILAKTALVLEVSYMPAHSMRLHVYFLQQKTKLLLTHFSNTLSLFCLILLFVNLAMMKPFQPFWGSPVKSLCLAHKLIYTLAPHCNISSNHAYIKEIPLGCIPTCTGSVVIITTPRAGRLVQGVLSCCLPPCILR